MPMITVRVWSDNHSDWPGRSRRHSYCGTTAPCSGPWRRLRPPGSLPTDQSASGRVGDSYSVWLDSTQRHSSPHTSCPCRAGRRTPLSRYKLYHRPLVRHLPDRRRRHSEWKDSSSWHSSQRTIRPCPTVQRTHRLPYTLDHCLLDSLCSLVLMCSEFPVVVMCSEFPLVSLCSELPLVFQSSELPLARLSPELTLVTCLQTLWRRQHSRRTAPGARSRHSPGPSLDPRPSCSLEIHDRLQIHTSRIFIIKLHVLIQLAADCSWY